jgi:hypothetical protein
MASLQDCSDGKRKSYKITKMQMFATSDKVKPYTKSTNGLNLAAVRLTTVQMTKLSLHHAADKDKA